MIQTALFAGDPGAAWGDIPNGRAGAPLEARLFTLAGDAAAGKSPDPLWRGPKLVHEPEAFVRVCILYPQRGEGGLGEERRSHDMGEEPLTVNCAATLQPALPSAVTILVLPGPRS